MDYNAILLTEKETLNSLPPHITRYTFVSDNLIIEFIKIAGEWKLDTIN